MIGCRGAVSVRTLANHCVAQRDIDLARTSHWSEDDASLDAYLDRHDPALDETLTRGLAEGELVAQIPCSGLAALRGNLQSGRSGADVDAGAFDVRR